MPTLGTQLMINQSLIKEKEISQEPQPEENLFNPVTLSFFYQENTEEEELSY